MPVTILIIPLSSALISCCKYCFLSKSIFADYFCGLTQISAANVNLLFKISKQQMPFSYYFTNSFLTFVLLYGESVCLGCESHLGVSCVTLFRDGAHVEGAGGVADAYAYKILIDLEVVGETLPVA